MAKIGYLIISEDIFRERDLLIKNPYNAISPVAVPGNFSFVLTFSLMELKEETDYTIIIGIKQPNGHMLLEPQMLDFNFSPPKEEKGRATGAALHINMNNVIFKEEGMHTFTVSIKHNDDMHTKDIEIPVIASGIPS